MDKLRCQMLTKLELYRQTHVEGVSRTAFCWNVKGKGGGETFSGQLPRNPHLPENDLEFKNCVQEGYRRLFWMLGDEKCPAGVRKPKAPGGAPRSF